MPNESSDLRIQVEAYKGLYGYYPKLVIADEIYATNENRKYCKEHEIKLTAKPKGRSKKLSPYEKSKRRKEAKRRNRIEGKIGQTKNGYKLNMIKAKLEESSESWIGIILFVANLINFAQFNNFVL